MFIVYHFQDPEVGDEEAKWAEVRSYLLGFHDLQARQVCRNMPSDGKWKVDRRQKSLEQSCLTELPTLQTKRLASVPPITSHIWEALGIRLRNFYLPCKANGYHTAQCAS